MGWLATLCLGSLCLRAQPPQDDLLQRIRIQMLKNLQEQPNYTCTETIERYYRSGPTRKFQLQDTLRLEVALVEGHEMFAFPGAKKFDAVPLNEMVGDTGAISNGDFALHARAIFLSRGAVFEFKGPGSDGNRKWVRFDYDVALNVSGFELKHGPNKAITPYHGSFEADPDSLDIQRIVVIADEIPAVIGFKKADKSLTFARLKIGDGTFLLPAESELTIVENNNAENFNKSKFSSCRQFTGESVLTFDDPSLTAPAAPIPIEEVTLPERIDLALTLDQTIESSKAAIGDPVTAHLLSDAKLKSRLIVPKGAIARGRVTFAEKVSGGLMLGIEFMEIEWPGSHAVLRARLDRIPNIVGPQRSFSIPPERPHEARIPLGSTQTNLPRGLLMFWTTTP